MARAKGGGGGSDLMTRLASASLINKVGLLMLVLGLAGLVYWQFFYKPLKADLKSEEAMQRGLLASKRKLVDRESKLDDKVKAAGVRNSKEYLTKLLEDAKGITVALPTEPELPSFIQHLQEKAGDAGVKFKSYGRLKEVPVQEYIKVPMSVEVEGSFYQLLEYFNFLGPKTDKDDDTPVPAPKPGAPRAPEKKEFKRIVSIENLSLDDIIVRNDEILLTARFTASTFRKEDKAAPAGKDAKDAKDAKGKAKTPAKPGTEKPAPVKGSAAPKTKLDKAKDDLDKNVKKLEKSVTQPIEKAKKQ